MQPRCEHGDQSSKLFVGRREALDLPEPWCPHLVMVVRGKMKSFSGEKALCKGTSALAVCCPFEKQVDILILNSWTVLDASAGLFSSPTTCVQTPLIPRVSCLCDEHCRVLLSLPQASGSQPFLLSLSCSHRRRLEEGRPTPLRRAEHIKACGRCTMPWHG